MTIKFETLELADMNLVAELDAKKYRL